MCISKIDLLHSVCSIHSIVIYLGIIIFKSNISCVSFFMAQVGLLLLAMAAAAGRGPCPGLGRLALRLILAATRAGWTNQDNASGTLFSR